MKKLRKSIVLVLALLCVSVSAQDSKGKVGVFKGRIMRSDKNQPIAKARILLMDDKKSEKQDNSVEAETDADGKFLFDNVKPGKYTISIGAIFAREEDVPCQFLMGKINEPNSQLLVITENNQKVEQIFIKGFSVKAGKEINKEYDLVCKSLFGK